MPAVVTVDGRELTVRTGKREPKRDPHTLKLATYLIPETLPAPPLTVPVPAVATWPMYGNDTLGDCTIASAGHMIQAWTLDAGRPRTPGDVAILSAYWATGNEDDGRYELDVLNYWRHTGIAGRKIRAYASVNALSRHDVKIAVYLFGGAYIGLALPRSAQRQAVWHVDTTNTRDARAGSWGGHAVPIVAYNATGLWCVTWGQVKKMTWPFFLRYCDEAYAILSPELLDTRGRSPEGFDLPALTADLTRITG